MGNFLTGCALASEPFRFSISICASFYLLTSKISRSLLSLPIIILELAMTLKDLISRNEGESSRSRVDARKNERPPPENPLAPKARTSNESTESGSKPASFTPMQLGPSSAHSSRSSGSINCSNSTVSSDAVRDVKAEILANWLHTKQEERVWTFGDAGEGVFMKKSKGSYSCAPFALQSDGTGLYEAVTELNVRVS